MNPILVLVGALSLFGLRGGSNAPALSLSLTLSERDVLVGELVPLAFALKNEGKQAIRIHALDGQNALRYIRITWSLDSGRLVDYEPPTDGLLKDSGYLQLLPDSKHAFRAWVLIFDKVLLELPADKAHPLVLRAHYNAYGRTISSPPLSLRVSQPDGEEARLRDTLTRPECRSFLLKGDGRQHDYETLLELLASSPKSRYGPGISYTLCQYYFKHRDSIPNELKRRTWKSAGIADVRDDLSDTRLDVPLGCDLGNSELTVAQLVRLFAASSSIPCEVSEELGNIHVVVVKNRPTVREFMEWTRQQVGGVWQRHKEAYVLASVAAPRDAK
jgi:hypothetical protein